MSGIYSIVSKNISIPGDNYKRFYSSKFSHTINEEFVSEGITYGRSTLPVFTDDRFVIDTPELVVCIEGVIYNQKSLKKELIKLYAQEGLDFLKELEGQFSGFIYDKAAKKLCVFNDHLSTKSLYFHYNKTDQLFCFASECKFISSLLNDIGRNTNIDHDSIKLLLSFGYLFDDKTPILEGKKLLPGSVLELDINSFELKQRKYFSFKKKVSPFSKSDIIERIDELLIRAVNFEWKKVHDYHISHYAQLSGGLDSRVNLLIADELGFTDISTITFSHGNSSDQTIAQEIANSINSSHHFYELTDEFLLQPLFNLIQANDGLNLFFNAAHTFTVSSSLNLQSVGAVHTGQIGDVLFGSFSNKPPLSKETIKKLAFRFDEGIFHSISDLENIIERYSFEGGAELFSIEQRQVNGTMSGDRIVSHLVDHLSPFYNKELLSFCLEIPDKYRIDEQIYLDWFNERHPKISEFRWQKSGTRPISQYHVKAGTYRKKLLRHLFRLFGSEYDNMNPFQVWYDSNNRMNEFYSGLFSELINLNIDKELKEMISETFRGEKAIDKMTAISVLYTIKLYTNQ